MAVSEPEMEKLPIGSLTLWALCRLIASCAQGFGRSPGVGSKESVISPLSGAPVALPVEKPGKSPARIPGSRPTSLSTMARW